MYWLIPWCFINTERECAGPLERQQPFYTPANRSINTALNFLDDSCMCFQTPFNWNVSVIFPKGQYVPSTLKHKDARLEIWWKCSESQHTERESIFRTRKQKSQNFNIHSILHCTYKNRMKSNKVKQNYSKYKKISTNIKGDLLLDDNFLPNHSKDDTLSTDAVSLRLILFTYSFQ